MAYEICLDSFKGPLDLLLHLIRKHEMDIYDIPIAEITAQYLATLEVMQSLNLDLAGEFLLMAATLLQIKSRMLLPQDREENEEAEEPDPRTELVNRLLEYQKYREVACCLESLPLLGRDVFVREVTPAEEGRPQDESPEWEPVGLFELVAAFHRVLSGREEEAVHEITREHLSVTERIYQILEALSDTPCLAFSEILADVVSRSHIIVTFLAMLELVRMRLARLMQHNPDHVIWIYAVDGGETVSVAEGQIFGYS